MVKILHIRCATIDVEERAKDVFTKLKEEGKISQDLILLFSYVWKHGIGKRINEVEIELFNLGGK